MFFLPQCRGHEWVQAGAAAAADGCNCCFVIGIWLSSHGEASAASVISLSTAAPSHHSGVGAVQVVGAAIKGRMQHLHAGLCTAHADQGFNCCSCGSTVDPRLAAVSCWRQAQGHAVMQCRTVAAGGVGFAERLLDIGHQHTSASWHAS
jgi:hypothetical protein